MVYLQKIVGFDAKKMYDIVADTSKYRLFIPFCTFSDKRKTNAPNTFKSTLTLQAPLEFSYESTVKTLPSLIVAEAKNQSIFSSLMTTWTFKPLFANISKIQIDIKYELKSPMFTPIANVLISKLTHTYISAFEKRAIQLHGKPTTPQSLLVSKTLSDMDRKVLIEYDKLYKGQ